MSDELEVATVEVSARQEVAARVLDAAADALLELTPQQILAKVSERKNARLATAEAGKEQPLNSKFELPKDEWAVLKDHIFDGGGVEGDQDVLQEVLQAAWNDRQDIFWPGLIHLLKARGKGTGKIIAQPNGGVTFNGVG